MEGNLNIELEINGKLAAALDKIQQMTGVSYAGIVTILLAKALMGDA